MTTLELTSVVVQLLLPIALISWVAFPRRRPRLNWTLDLAVAAACIAAIGLAVPWLALPWYLPAVFAALLLGSAALGAPRVRRDSASASGRLRARVGLGARILALVTLATVTVLALAGRQRFPESAVDLEFPLRTGTYLIANGGSRTIVNPHLMTRTGVRYASYRGQSYALDIVKIGLLGIPPGSTFARRPGGLRDLRGLDPRAVCRDGGPLDGRVSGPARARSGPRTTRRQSRVAGVRVRLDPARPHEAGEREGGGGRTGVARRRAGSGREQRAIRRAPPAHPRADSGDPRGSARWECPSP
jgi:hypothetical protein